MRTLISGGYPAMGFCQFFPAPKPGRRHADATRVCATAQRTSQRRRRGGHGEFLRGSQHEVWTQRTGITNFGWELSTSYGVFFLAQRLTLWRNRSSSGRVRSRFLPTRLSFQQRRLTGSFAPKDEEPPGPGKPGRAWPKPTTSPQGTRRQRDPCSPPRARPFPTPPHSAPRGSARGRSGAAGTRWPPTEIHFGGVF